MEKRNIRKELEELKSTKNISTEEAVKILIKKYDDYIYEFLKDDIISSDTYDDILLDIVREI